MQNQPQNGLENAVPPKLHSASQTKHHRVNSTPGNLFLIICGVLQNSNAAAQAIASAQSQGQSAAVAQAIANAISSGQSDALAKALSQVTGAPQDQASSAAQAIANAQSQVRHAEILVSIYLPACARPEYNS